MDFITIIKGVRDLSAAIKASDWGAALTAIIAILSVFATSQPQPPVRMKAGGADHADATAAIAELEACCSAHKPMMADEGAAYDWKAFLVNTLLPDLLAALKAYLGL